MIRNLFNFTQEKRVDRNIYGQMRMEEILLIFFFKSQFVSSVRSSNSHPDLLLTQHHHQHPTFSDHIGPQYWTFTF